MAGFVEKIKALLTSFTQTTGGVEATLLVDLSDATVQVSYPEGESLHFIGTASADSISNFESGIQSLGGKFSVQEMELVSQEKRVFTLRISNDPDYVLCVVCPINGAKAGVIRTKFLNSVKNEIITAMKEGGLIKKE